MPRRILFILLLFNGLAAHGQTSFGWLENGNSQYEKELYVEAEEAGDLEINALTATFSGNFHHAYLDVESFTIDWDGSWFANEPSDVEFAWSVSNDSLTATFEVWRSDYSNATGHGEFFRISHPGGVDILVLDGVLKQGHAVPINVNTNQDARMRLEAFPNPAKDHIEWKCKNCGDDVEYRIFNYVGEEIFKTAWSRADISKLETGLYFLKAEARASKGTGNAVLRIMVQ